VSRGSSAREQENPEVREGVGIANQYGSIVSSHKSTTSSSSYSSSIAQAKPQHLKKARETPIEPLRSLYAETSSPWQSQPLSPRVIAETTPPAILHPLQLFPWQASSLLAEPFQSHLTVRPTPEPHHCRALLTADSVHRGNSLSARSHPQPRLPQGLP
jgi:hypothetical protein